MIKSTATTHTATNNKLETPYTTVSAVFVITVDEEDDEANEDVLADVSDECLVE